MIPNINMLITHWIKKKIVLFIILCLHVLPYEYWNMSRNLYICLNETLISYFELLLFYILISNLYCFIFISYYYRHAFPEMVWSIFMKLLELICQLYFFFTFTPLSDLLISISMLVPKDDKKLLGMKTCKM